MRFLSRRPFAAFSLSFYVAACILFEVPVVIKAVVGLGALLLFLTMGLGKGEHRYKRGAVFISLGCLAAVLLSAAVTDVYIPVRLENVSSSEERVTGTVVEVRGSYVYGGVYTLSVESGSCRGMKVLYTCSDGELSVGDRIGDTVLFGELDSDYKNSYVSDGILATAESAGDGIPERMGDGGGIGIAVARLRGRISSFFRASMTGENGGFAAALLMGDKSGLSDSCVTDFRTLGVSHLLAISGTHLAVIFASARNAGKGGKGRRLVSFSLFAAALVGYMALAGFSASVVRAGIMLLITRAATLVKRKSDSATVLGAAVLLICIADPISPIDMGLQLSFAGVVGVLASGSVLGRLKGRGIWRSPAVRRLLTPFLSSLIVSFVILPVLWLRFGEVSLLMPVATTVLLPTVALLIPIFLLLLVISPVPQLFLPVAALADKLVGLYLSVIHQVASAADPILPMWGVAMAALAMALMIAVFLTEGKGRRVTAALLALFVSSSMIVSQAAQNRAHNGLTLCYSANGADDGVCFFSGGHTVLVDVGRYKGAVYSAAELAHKRGSGRIDSLVLTRLYRRHTAAVAELCQRYYIRELWLPVPSEDKEALCQSIRDVAQRYKVTVRTYHPGETLSFGFAELKAPEMIPSATSTVDDVRFTVTVGDGSVGYTTDGITDGDIRIIGGGGGGAFRGIVTDDVTTVVSPRVAAESASVGLNAEIRERYVIRPSREGDPD